MSLWFTFGDYMIYWSNNSCITMRYNTILIFFTNKKFCLSQKYEAAVCRKKLSSLRSESWCKGSFTGDSIYASNSHKLYPPKWTDDRYEPRRVHSGFFGSPKRTSASNPINLIATASPFALHFIRIKSFIWVLKSDFALKFYILFKYRHICFVISFFLEQMICLFWDWLVFKKSF